MEKLPLWVKSCETSAWFVCFESNFLLFVTSCSVFVAGGSIWSISWGGIRSWSATSSSKAASSTTTTKPWIYNEGATDQSEEVLSQKKYDIHTLVNSAFIKHVSTQHLFIKMNTQNYLFSTGTIPKGQLVVFKWGWAFIQIQLITCSRCPLVCGIWRGWKLTRLWMGTAPKNRPV